MRTIRTKVYKFNELSKDAQKRAIENLSDINVNYDWWTSIYQDAEMIGLKISGFDLDRNRRADGEFIEDGAYSAKMIMQEHGESGETYKTAVNYYAMYQDLVGRAQNENKDGDEDYWFSSEIEEIDEAFLKALLEDYSMMLQRECEYQQGDEAIQETIEANEYEFTQDGKMI